MKLVKKISILSLPVISFVLMTGCAAGSATAGYSLKAMTADGLTADAEQRIVERTKREVMAELSAPAPCQQRGY